MNALVPIEGASHQTRTLLDFIEKASSCDENVLMLGETGVGKELAARTIHRKSLRKDCNFVKINCANLSDNLLESELFGHKKGAFTGAIIDKPGLIEIARGGTFFFDEVGDLSPFLQAKLLAAIEDKEIRRVGETHIRKIDVRFIFATNKDIGVLLSKGKFRQDLFYRISIYTYYIAPLRDRKEDIPLIVKAILRNISPHTTSPLAITEAALEKMAQLSFPGNIRELENILRRAGGLSCSGVIKEDDIIFQQVGIVRHEKRHCFPQKYKIIEALIECDGNKTKAAELLGISRVHLYRLLNHDVHSK